MSYGITALCSLFSILLLVILWFWLYRDYRVDAARQKLFEIRDELFDYANSGKISFEDPAYERLRRTINGFVRFAHRMNLIHILIMSIVLKKKHYKIHTFQEKLTQEIKNLEEEKKDIYRSIHFRINYTIVEYLVLSSPLFLIAMMFHYQVKSFVNKYRGPIDRINVEAFETGNI